MRCTYASGRDGDLGAAELLPQARSEPVISRVKLMAKSWKCI
jgi:hypothetical protein